MNSAIKKANSTAEVPRSVTTRPSIMCKYSRQWSVSWKQCCYVLLPLAMAIYCAISYHASTVGRNYQRMRECIPNDTLRPPSQIVYRNELWQVEKDNNSETVIFAAYYDDREHAMAVRVITVSSTRRAQMFCKYWLDRTPLPSLWPADELEGGRGASYENVYYMERIYVCPFPFADAFPANEVSLVYASTTDRPSNIVPIQMPSKTQQYQLGVCVSVTYGTMDPVRLIEWLELNKALGVQEFNFYTSRPNREALIVLEAYKAQGSVNIFNMTPPFEFPSEDTEWCLWCQFVTVLAALNDCMYRNMYRYKHLLTLDVDEIIAPKNKAIISLVDLLQQLERDQPSSAYEFRNTYFFFDLNETTVHAYRDYLGGKPIQSGSLHANQRKVADTALSPQQDRLFQTFLHVHTFAHTISTRYLSHVEHSPVGYSPKSAINPRECIVLQNHYCMTKVPHAKPVLHVATDLATSNHYKKCHFSKKECEATLRRSAVDDTMLKYGDELVSNVFRQYNEISPRFEVN